MPKPITPDLADFENGEGVVVRRPVLTRFDDLLRLACKPTHVIQIKYKEACTSEQNLWLNEVLDIDEHNAKEEIPVSLGLDEEGIEQFKDPDYKEFPPRPEELSWEEWIATEPEEYLQHAKHLGVEFKGVKVTLNQSNQNGFVALKLWSDTVSAAGGTIFPAVFAADTATSVDYITFEDEGEFMSFMLAFAGGRTGHFNKKAAKKKKKGKKKK